MGILKSSRYCWNMEQELTCLTRCVTLITRNAWTAVSFSVLMRFYSEFLTFFYLNEYVTTICCACFNELRLSVLQTGSTALHHAATYGHEEVASVLLDHKAFVNGRTKVYWCVSSQSFHLYRTSIYELYLVFEWIPCFVVARGHSTSLIRWKRLRWTG